MVRLRRVRTDIPGWSRRRAGRGWVYLDADGVRITDPDVVARCTDLVIPPAWRDVWICPHPNGHIQALGTDDAGRRQYLYHPQWRLRRDRAKHDHVLDVAYRLPTARRDAAAALDLDGMPQEKALALAFRLLDLGYFRIGSESYARSNGSYGLATLLRSHVRLRHGSLWFTYPAKSGQVRRIEVTDPAAHAAVSVLRSRRSGGPELLAYKEGGRWRDVGSADIVRYVKDLLGEDATPKDFRTWHATVLAAQGLAAAGPAPRAQRARARAERAVVRAVAEELGNTPAVCRSSYIDPRLFDLWEDGETIPVTRSRPRAEGAVRRLLRSA